MSILNPIRSQYKRLMELMNGLHCAELSAAASAMRVKEPKVQDSLDKMIRKNLFGEDRPYIDHGLPAVIQDRRYQGFAELYASSARLKWSLRRMYNVCILTPEEKSQVRARAAGEFIREVVGSAFTPSGAGSVFRKKGGNFLRDLMAPEASMPDQSAQTCTSILTEHTERLLSWLQSHPEEDPDPELTTFIRGVDRQVQSFISCYPTAGLPNASQRRNAESILQSLQTEVIPKFSAMLDALSRGELKRKTDQTSDQEELREQARQLMTLSSQMSTRHMRASVSRLSELLNEIADQLSLSPSRSAASCVRSLHNVYLPMTQELLMKYMRYERSIDPGPEVVSAMRNTESVLDEDLPKALRQMLSDLRSDSAIDMESQASALRTKMRIDGMIN